MHKYNNIRLHKYANTQNTNTQIWSCRNTLTEHIKARKLGALAGLFLSATLSFLSCSSQRCTLSGKILRFYSAVLPSIYDRTQELVLLSKRQSNPPFLKRFDERLGLLPAPNIGTFSPSMFCFWWWRNYQSWFRKFCVFYRVLFAKSAILVGYNEHFCIRDSMTGLWWIKPGNMLLFLLKSPLFQTIK